MKRSPEEQEQIRLAAKLDRAGFDWFHCPNGGKRGKATGYLFKLMGVKRGIPDILIITEPRTAIELKRPDGKGRLSDDQKQWREKFRRNGWNWFRCDSEAEALDVIEKVYGCRLKKKTLPKSARVVNKS